MGLGQFLPATGKGQKQLGYVCIQYLLYNNEGEVNMKSICNFLREEEGLTTVEYAVAGSLVAAAVVLAFTALGVQVGTVIDGLCTAINGNAACP
jgi:pilus assembly protein Flp/PilA